MADVDTNAVGPFKIFEHQIHLGLGATTVPQPTFTGMEWYEAYGKRVESDGIEGRLIQMSTFTESWDMWEMHPMGSELVLITEGELVLTQEAPDGEISQVTITAGSYAINPPRYWHTADVSVPTTALFVTAGQGTQHRPR